MGKRIAHGGSDGILQFSVGVNYWPRSSGPAMWSSFDAGEIAEDFARMAELGFDGLRFFVRWDVFQPEPDHIDAAMLERLATLLSLARDAGLRTVPALYCGHTTGANYLPAWALDRKRTSRFPTITGTTVSSHGAADIYGTALREPQLLLARTLGERFGGHPAIRAWDIGNAFSRVREPVHAKLATGEHSSEPAGEREMAAWSAAIAKALRETARTPVTATASFDDLAQDRDVRLGLFSTPFAYASIGGLNVENPFGRNRLDAEATPFLANATASFSFQPVFVSAFGLPACAPGRFSAFERFAQPGEPPLMTISPDDTVFTPYPCASDDEIAAFATAVLERLHADGRLGAYWYAWADYAAGVLDDAVLRDSRHEAACGLIACDGSEKPVTRAIAAFARERRDVVRSNDMTMIAAAYYYRTLPKSARDLYGTYLRHATKRSTTELPPRSPQ